MHLVIIIIGTIEFKVPRASMHEHTVILRIFDHYLANGP
jgi:hypothetical protein